MHPCPLASLSPQMWGPGSPQPWKITFMLDEQDTRPQGFFFPYKEHLHPIHSPGAEPGLRSSLGSPTHSGPAPGRLFCPYLKILCPSRSWSPLNLRGAPSPAPTPGLHQHAGSGRLNTRGLFSSHALGPGLGAGGPHTLAGPGHWEAGLPHPVSPDRLCALSLLPSLPPWCLIPGGRRSRLHRWTPRVPSSSSGFPHRLPSWLDWGDFQL